MHCLILSKAFTYSNILFFNKNLFSIYYIAVTQLNPVLSEINKTKSPS